MLLYLRISESKAEYVKRFVNGTIGQMTWNNCPERVGPPVDLTASDSGPLSPNWTQRLAPLEISDEEAASLGYMHKRDDYEKVKSLKLEGTLNVCQLR